MVSRRSRARSVSRACCSATSRLSSWARRRGSGTSRRFFRMPLVLISSHPVSLRCILFHQTIAPLLNPSPSVAIVPLRHGGHDEFRKGDAHPRRSGSRLGHASITTTLNVYGHLCPPLGAPLDDKIEAVHRDATATLGLDGR